MSVMSKPRPMMLMSQPKPNDAFEWTQAPWGTVIRCLPLAAIADHFFTARDLSLSHGNTEEWAEVAGRIGVSLENLLLIRQVHDAEVVFAPAGRIRPWSVPQSDVIASDDPASAIGVRVADCVPILLADARGRAVAAVHAGWRGVARRAPAAGVAALGEYSGVKPERLIAAIGPSIGRCCYEVGEETRAGFEALAHRTDDLDRWFSPGPAGKWYLDLWRATRDQLAAAGVPPSRIHVAGLCTKTHSDTFHTFRVDRERAGRMVAVIRARAGSAA
jgi:YfiH family protein